MRNKVRDIGAGGGGGGGGTPLYDRNQRVLV